jgi:hypothetical protein
MVYGDGGKDGVTALFALTTPIGCKGLLSLTPPYPAEVESTAQEALMYLDIFSGDQR